MELIIFFAVVFLFMIIDDRNIKKDIEASAKSPFTKKDAEHYYKNFDEHQ
jgi:hypothetical protein